MKNLNNPFLQVFSHIYNWYFTYLTYKTEYGVFLIASFGSTMVLLYGYPESPFAQPKIYFFGHLNNIIGWFFFYLYNPLPLYINLPLAVGVGVFLMILLNITHPPARNPIIVIMGSVSLDYILNPIITGSIIIFNFWYYYQSFYSQEKIPNKLI